MKEFFMNIWAKCVELYMMYSDFVHSILKDQLGDLAVYVINIAVVSAIVIVIARMAFGTKNNG